MLNGMTLRSQILPHFRQANRRPHPLRQFNPRPMERKVDQRMCPLQVRCILLHRPRSTTMNDRNNQWRKLARRMEFRLF